MVLYNSGYVPRMELIIEARRRLRTLSCTRERRGERESEMRPASSALEEGRGLCMVWVLILWDGFVVLLRGAHSGP